MIKPTPPAEHVVFLPSPLPTGTTVSCSFLHSFVIQCLIAFVCIHSSIQTTCWLIHVSGLNQYHVDPTCPPHTSLRAGPYTSDLPKAFCV